MASGGCLCGAVRFTVSGKLRDIVNCHCGMCVRWHGNFAAYTNAPRDRVAFERQDGLAWHQSSSVARRGFCKVCGSSLFWERLGGAELGIAAGALDAPTGLQPRRHIFVADKPDWYDIPDGLEQFPAGSA